MFSFLIFDRDQIVSLRLYRVTSSRLIFDRDQSYHVVPCNYFLDNIILIAMSCLVSPRFCRTGFAGMIKLILAWSWTTNLSTLVSSSGLNYMTGQ